MCSGWCACTKSPIVFIKSSHLLAACTVKEVGVGVFVKEDNTTASEKYIVKSLFEMKVFIYKTMCEQEVQIQ